MEVEVPPSIDVSQFVFVRLFFILLHLFYKQKIACDVCRLL